MVGPLNRPPDYLIIPALVTLFLLLPLAASQAISFEVEREFVDVWILKDGSVAKIAEKHYILGMFSIQIPILRWKC